MKKILFALSVALILTACAPPAGPTTSGALLVTSGESQQSFTPNDLAGLPATEASFNEVAYKGVTVSALLEAIGVDAGGVRAIKAVASDGYSVNYDPAQVLKENVIVAYTLADGGAMSTDDGDFRMVLPEEEGKLNVRMLVELQVIQ